MQQQQQQHYIVELKEKNVFFLSSIFAEIQYSSLEFDEMEKRMPLLNCVLSILISVFSMLSKHMQIMFSYIFDRQTIEKCILICGNLYEYGPHYNFRLLLLLLSSFQRDFAHIEIILQTLFLLFSLHEIGQNLKAKNNNKKVKNLTL